MFDEKFLKLIMEGGVSLTAIFLLYRLLVLVLSMWKAQQETQQRAFDHQRKDHEFQADLLKGAHTKLDVIVKGVHR